MAVDSKTRKWTGVQIKKSMVCKISRTGGTPFTSSFNFVQCAMLSQMQSSVPTEEGLTFHLVQCM